jgi:hypothetical protein
MDRNDNLGINPGNGPATWQRGSKPQQRHQAEEAFPQEFTSSMPADRDLEQEAADSAAMDARDRARGET